MPVFLHDTNELSTYELNMGLHIKTNIAIMEMFSSRAEQVIQARLTHNISMIGLARQIAYSHNKQLGMAAIAMNVYRDSLFAEG